MCGVDVGLRFFRAQAGCSTGSRCCKLVQASCPVHGDVANVVCVSKGFVVSADHCGRRPARWAQLTKKSSGGRRASSGGRPARNQLAGVTRGARWRSSGGRPERHQLSLRTRASGGKPSSCSLLGGHSEGSGGNQGSSGGRPGRHQLPLSHVSGGRPGGCFLRGGRSERHGGRQVSSGGRQVSSGGRPAWGPPARAPGWARWR